MDLFSPIMKRGEVISNYRYRSIWNFTIMIDSLAISPRPTLSQETVRMTSDCINSYYEIIIDELILFFFFFFFLVFFFLQIINCNQKAAASSSPEKNKAYLPVLDSLWTHSSASFSGAVSLEESKNSTITCLGCLGQCCGCLLLGTPSLTSPAGSRKWRNAQR